MVNLLIQSLLAFVYYSQKKSSIRLFEFLRKDVVDTFYNTYTDC